MKKPGIFSLAMLLGIMAALTASAEENQCIGTHATANVNDVSLYYEVAGEGKPVVLVSANGGDHTNFSTEISQLVAAGYQVYALDSRGQGQNEPLTEYHYADMVEDVYQFINAMDLQAPAYYGWSDGGIIGIMLELTHPGTLSAMAVSGANINTDGADPEDETVIWVKSMLEESDDPLLKLMFSEPDIDPETLSAIEIPVLVTAGSDDLILRDHTQLIADSIPDSELKIIEGEDHQSYIVDSEIMGELLIDFLQRHGY